MGVLLSSLSRPRLNRLSGPNSRNPRGPPAPAVGWKSGWPSCTLAFSSGVMSKPSCAEPARADLFIASMASTASTVVASGQRRADDARAVDLQDPDRQRLPTGVRRAALRHRQRRRHDPPQQGGGRAAAAAGVLGAARDPRRGLGGRRPSRRPAAARAGDQRGDPGRDRRGARRGGAMTTPAALRDTAWRWLFAGRPAMQVQVRATQGSAPREAGTRMLVAADAVAGTIG